MRRIVLFIFLLISLSGKAQHNDDVGIMVGGAYYLGDINPSQHFYSPKPMFGFIYRYNFNDCYALRACTTLGKIEASDLDFSNQLQQDRKARFSNEYMSFALQFEYNFFSFWVPKQRWSKKTIPYLSLGVGYSLNTSESTVFIPFSIGMKRVILKNYTLGLEWTFSKSFTDDLDYLSDPMETGESSSFINNDWVVYVAMSFTYRFSVDKACRFFNEK